MHCGAASELDRAVLPGIAEAARSIAASLGGQAVLFYGSILGVFILAVGFKRANSTGAFAGMIAGMTVIVLVATYTKIAFLWHNPIAAFVVVSVGLAVSAMTGGSTSGEQQPAVAHG